MFDIRRILCPIDFSDASRHALDHAVAIGEWYSSRLAALHVHAPAFLPTPPLLFAEGRHAVVGDEADRAHLTNRLDDWLAPARRAGLAVDLLVEEGKASTRRILDYAASWPADLIVMGTHGRGGFDRLMLGSVTEKVLRKARCPVLTVPPKPIATSKLPFGHVLCPLDFSESSLAALAFAFSLAQESNARLTLLHVFEWPADEAAASGVLEKSEFRRQWEVETRRKLDALVPVEVRNWCVPGTRLAFGKAYGQILRLAADEHVDLIVMGVQGRNAVDLMLFGSTTNHVVRQACCPVLTLKH